MQIGTDGVLLGAWVSLAHQPATIVDLGTGTGVIALQLAQRSDAPTIDAVEIDSDAYEQCTENFENAPWADRLFCYHASVQEFALEMEETYDLIVSNPPFYAEDYKTSSIARDQARFTDALPFEHLVAAAYHLLSKEGVFAVILPKKEETHFIELAAEAGLFPQRICRVQGSITSEEKRSLLEFSYKKQAPVIEKLSIEISRHQYTKEYTDLVADFYLNM